MNLKLIPKKSYVSMPWKNGLGTTSEIDIFPESSSMAGNNFLWRLSTAQIQAANNFSEFAGYNRWLCVIAGPGLILNEIRLEPFSPLRFSGEEKIHCEVQAAQTTAATETTDLGLIYNREFVRAEMNVLKMKGPQILDLESGTYYLISDTEMFVGGAKVHPGDTMRLTDAKTVQMMPAEPQMKLCLIRVLQLPIKKTD